MKNRDSIFRLNYQPRLVLLAVLLVCTSVINAQKIDDKEYLRAMDLVRTGKNIEALPILEKIAPRYTQDAELQASYGVAILANAVTISEPTARKKELVRAEEVLKKAKILGTKNVTALHYLDLAERGAYIDSVSPEASGEVQEAIREGEGFYGRGEYEKALVSYGRAHKLDPKNYSAVLFSGDCFYAQKKYSDAIIWFAKAVAIDPDREAAYRFWADALVFLNRKEEAGVKYAESFIADPESRMTLNGLIEATRNFGARRTSPFILIPSDNDTEIIIEPALLPNQVEKDIWNKFTETRKFQTIDSPSRRPFISTFSENLTAMKSVAAAAKSALEKDKNFKLSKSLENLVKIDSLGMLDVYLSLFISSKGSEYSDFKRVNKERMIEFLTKYFINDSL